MSLTTVRGAVFSSQENNMAINVKDAPYNAKGDGVTDDTAAIQAAIDAVALNGGGGKVFIPKGTYLVSSELVIQEHTTGNRQPVIIEGEGRASIIKSAVTGAGNYVFNFDGDIDGVTAGAEMYGAGLRNLTIEGDSSTTVNAIRMYAVTRIGVLEGLQISSFTGTYCLLDECTNFNVCDVFCVGGGSGVGTIGFDITNANQVTLSNVYALNMANTSIGVKASNIDGFAIYGGTFEQVKYGVYLNDATSDVGGVVLSNIYTERLYEDSATTAAGIYVGADAVNPVKNVSIIGGHVLGGISGGGNGRACIVVDYCEHCTIQNVGLGASFNEVEVTTNASDVSFTGSTVTLVGTNAPLVKRPDQPYTYFPTTAPPNLGSGSGLTADTSVGTLTANDFSDSRSVKVAIIQVTLTVNTVGTSGRIAMSFLANGSHANGRQWVRESYNGLVSGDVVERTVFVPVNTSEQFDYQVFVTGGASWNIDWSVEQIGAVYQ